MGNTGTFTGRSGDATATGQNGSNRTEGTVGVVDAAGGGTSAGSGAPTTAANSQSVSSDNHDVGIARSGDVSGEGIGSATTFISNPGGGSATTGGATSAGNSGVTTTNTNTTLVTNLGIASGISGGATATGQNGNNTTTASVGTVDAAGGGNSGTVGAGATLALNEQILAAINHAVARAHSGDVDALGLDAETDVSGLGAPQVTTGGSKSGARSSAVTGSGNNVTVTDTGQAGGLSGNTNETGQNGNNTATLTVADVDAAGGGSSGTTTVRVVSTVITP